MCFYSIANIINIIAIIVKSLSFRVAVLLLLFNLINQSALGQGIIYDISPANLSAGTKGILLIKGRQTNWQSGAVKIQTPANISIQNILVRDVETIQAFYSVNSNANLGSFPIIVEAFGQINNSLVNIEISNNQSLIRATLFPTPLQNLRLIDFDPEYYPFSPEFFNVNLQVTGTNQNISLVTELIVDDEPISTDKVIWRGTKVFLSLNAGSYSVSSKDFTQIKGSTQRLSYQGDARQSGYLPAGNYSITLKVFNSGNLVEEYEHNFIVAGVLNKPELIYPYNSFSKENIEINNTLPIFQWFGTGGTYDVVVYEVPEEMTDPEIALLRPLYVKVNLTCLFFSWTPDLPQLRSEVNYAWQIIMHPTGTGSLPSPLGRFTIVNRSKKNIPNQDVPQEIIIQVDTSKFNSREKFNYTINLITNKGDTFLESSVDKQIIPESAGLILDSIVIWKQYRQDIPTAIKVSFEDEEDFFVLNGNSYYGDTNKVKQIEIDKYERGWTMVYPRLSESLEQGAAIIVVEISNEILLRKSTIEIFLDDILITENVKYEKNRLYILIDNSLALGKHRLEIKARPSNVWFLPRLRAEFFVTKGISINKPVLLTPITDADSINILNDTNRIITKIKSRNTLYSFGSQSGNAINNRFTQGYHSYTTVNSSINANKSKLELYGRLNSDQFSYGLGTMDKNYFKVKWSRKKMVLVAGDNNPDYDELICSGIRIRGLSFHYNFNPALNFKLTTGLSNTNQLDYSTLSNVNPATGSYYNSDRVYLYNDPTNYNNLWRNRSYTSAAQLSFGNLKQGSVLSLNILKSRESIIGNTNDFTPSSDNIVIGMSEQYRSKLEHLKIYTSIAYSIYTPIRNVGPAESIKMDSLLRRKYPIQPIDLNNIFTINTSTLGTGKSSLAGIFKIEYKIKNHILEGVYKNIGAAYISQGNPFFRNDINSIQISDQVRLFKNKLYTTLSYMYHINNLVNNALNTITGHNAALNSIYKKSHNSPYLQINLNSQYRFNAGNRLNSLSYSDLWAMGGLTVGKSISISKIPTQLSLSANYLVRNDLIVESNKNKNLIVNAQTSMAIDYRNSLNISLGYSPIQTQFSFSNTSTLNSHLVYSKRLTDNRSLQLQYTLNLMIQNSSQRHLGSIVYSQTLFGLNYTAELGYNPFYSSNEILGRYSELYVRINFNYSLYN